MYFVFFFVCYMLYVLMSLCLSVCLSSFYIHRFSVFMGHVALNKFDLNLNSVTQQ